MHAAPPVPDAFLLKVARAAGPLYERVWKMHQVNAMIEVAISWFRKVAINDQHLLYVHWHPGKRRSNADRWNWQPLMYHKGDDMKQVHPASDGGACAPPAATSRSDGCHRTMPRGRH